MKNHKELILVVILVAVLIASGIFLVIFMTQSDTADGGRSKTVDAAGIQTFADWTDCEVFQNVPALVADQTKIGEAVDYGSDNFVIDVNGTDVEDYNAYVALLQEAGFTKHSDNSEDAMEGYVYTSNFIRNNITLTVSHAVSLEKTYISATEGLALSEHLTYSEEFMKGVTADAKTKVHMLELNNNGASFVIQLKNGNFVLHDGGMSNDAPYLLDYLEKLTPGDEKPVIEGWFISHAHGDHFGAMQAILNDQKYIDRIIVNGVYFTEPPEEVVAKMGYKEQGIWIVNMGYKSFKNEDGERAEFYRPALGQRYYFCDITIDVSFTPEQIPYDSYYDNDFNDTSIWLMHNIEGQKLLIVGDTNQTGMRLAMNMYEEEYFDMDIYAVAHHGINVYDYFTDYCTFETALYPNWRVGSLWQDTSKRTDLTRISDNKHLQEVAKECYSFQDGTVVLTFPYKLGSVEIMEPLDWRYNLGVRQRTAFE